LLVVVAGLFVSPACAYDPFQADVDAQFFTNTTNKFHSRLSMSFAQVCVCPFCPLLLDPPVKK